MSGAQYRPRNSRCQLGWHGAAASLTHKKTEAYNFLAQVKSAWFRIPSQLCWTSIHPLLEHVFPSNCTMHPLIALNGRFDPQTAALNCAVWTQTEMILWTSRIS